MLVASIISLQLMAQWVSGEVYREYSYLTPQDGEAFLRVGGRLGYANTTGSEWIDLEQEVDLDGAVRATVTVERVLSHEDSRDLRLSVNDHPPIEVPEPASIPEPQTEYMYHTDLTVELPLEQLLAGTDNRFRLTLDTVQRWGWPQNLLYAVIFRVYYEPTQEPPNIDYPFTEVPAASWLRLTGLRRDDVRADYIFVGRDVDWSGRGVQEREHWQTHRGAPLRILGSATSVTEAFPVAWQTDWLPDQPRSFGVRARILGADGKYRVAEPLTDLKLAPRPYKVTVYGGEAPRNWVTRSGEFDQTLTLADSVAKIQAYRLNWVSWSPCYANGVTLNGHLVWDRTPDCYVFATHAPEYTGLALKYLQDGGNVIATRLTPLFRGEMVHGMEVQWPGFQLLVRRSP